MEIKYEPTKSDEESVAYISQNRDDNKFLIIKEDVAPNGAIAISKLGVGVEAKWLCPTHKIIKKFYKGDEVTIKF